jgi:ParB family chromosome partitioning protein
MSSEEGGKRRGLGRGLSALLGEDEADLVELDKVRSSKTVAVELIHPGRFQPRHGFDEDRINDLVESIKEKGILQPILVRRDPENRNHYEIIAGERRWRAAQLAQLHEVPVIVKDLSDGEALEVALVENLQRQDLSPLEEADGYRRLMDEFEHTQEDLAKAVGKSRSHVANMMRLLGLPDAVKEMVEKGQLTAGHARALLAAGDPIVVARKVAAKGLNVRQTEKLVQAESGAKGKKTPAGKSGKGVDADTAALERDLGNLLGLKVNIKFHGQGGGQLIIHYSSLEQLDDVLHRLSQPHAKKDDDGIDPIEPLSALSALGGASFLAESEGDEEAGEEGEGEEADPFHIDIDQSGFVSETDLITSEANETEETARRTGKN